MFRNVALGGTGLANGVIFGPIVALRVVTAVIARSVVVMGAFQHFQKFKALAAFRRNVAGATVAIQMPFAHVGRVIAAGAKGLRQRHRIIAQTDIVDKDAMLIGIAPGEQ